MKKLFSIMMILIIAISLVACGLSREDAEIEINNGMHLVRQRIQKELYVPVKEMYLKGQYYKDFKEALEILDDIQEENNDLKKIIEERVKNKEYDTEDLQHLKRHIPQSLALIDAGNGVIEELRTKIKEKMERSKSEYSVEFISPRDVGYNVLYNNQAYSRVWWEARTRWGMNKNLFTYADPTNGLIVGGYNSGVNNLGFAIVDTFSDTMGQYITVITAVHNFGYESVLPAFNTKLVVGPNDQTINEINHYDANRIRDYAEANYIYGSEYNDFDGLINPGENYVIVSTFGLPENRQGSFPEDFEVIYETPLGVEYDRKQAARELTGMQGKATMPWVTPYWTQGLTRKIQLQ